MKGTTRGRIGRVCHLARKNDPLLPCTRVRLGHRRQQGLGVRMARGDKQGFGGGDFHKLAKIHHSHPVADMFHHAQIMRHKQIAQAKPVLQIKQEIDDLRLHRHIKGRDRFIRHNQRRVERQGPRDADALALSAGKGMWKAVHIGGGQADKIEQFTYTRAALAFIVHAVDQQGFGNQIAHHHARIERGERVLEDHLHMPPEGFQFGFLQRREIGGFSVNRDVDFTR